MKQGDEAAFTALYRRHKDAIYRFALMCTGSPASAAEVTQETFLHLMTRADQFDPGRGTIAAWLCGVARNLARKEHAGREIATHAKSEFTLDVRPVVGNGRDTRRAVVDERRQ